MHDQGKQRERQRVGERRGGREGAVEKGRCSGVGCGTCVSGIAYGVWRIEGREGIRRTSRQT